MKYLGLLLISIFLSGCMAASVPVMPDTYDAQAERFLTPKGKANIYVVREDAFAGSAIVFQVLVNGQVQGAIAPGTYFLFEVQPGVHTVASITQESADSETIQASAGSNYFVEIKPVMGWAAARSSVETIDDLRGRKLVMDGKRAETMVK